MSVVKVVCSGGRSEHPSRKLAHLTDRREEHPLTEQEYADAARRMLGIAAEFGAGVPSEHDVENYGRTRWLQATKVSYRGTNVRVTSKGGVMRSDASKSVSAAGDPRVFTFTCRFCGRSSRVTEEQVNGLMASGAPEFDIATID